MTDRRSFLATVAVTLLAVPLASHAQQPAKVWHIGYLAAGARPQDGAPPSALRYALRELGYAEGRSVIFTSRWAEARSERLPALAAELVALKVDLIVTLGWKGAHALKDATSTIPIVFVGAGDPAGSGLAASLSRPGGNATGISDQSVELSAKRL